MTAKKYRTERRKRGTPQQVADATGVHVGTIHKREAGIDGITQQAAMLLLSLPLLPKPVPSHVRGRKPGSKTRNRKP
jgi:hypothetical protein